MCASICGCENKYLNLYIDINGCLVGKIKTKLKIVVFLLSFPAALKEQYRIEPDRMG